MSKDVLKVGDRIRLSTGVEVEVRDIINKQPYVLLDGEKVQTYLPLLERYGITWEIIKPELAEPPVGSVIRFFSDEFPVVCERGSRAWWCIGEDRSYTWNDLVVFHRITNYELLAPVKNRAKDEIINVWYDTEYA